ncbi:MAG TPA: methionine ABC transporter ATP-binding protein, partial [Porphyromonadaceae bacterium]|nr:methionine ABC transporter ATP-binding protein [Porphyromonadaceae bacterium]
MIEVKDLHKSYGRQGKVNALNSISFTVDDGEIFGV